MCYLTFYFHLYLLITLRLQIGTMLICIEMSIFHIQKKSTASLKYSNTFCYATSAKSVCTGAVNRRIHAPLPKFRLFGYANINRTTPIVANSLLI